VPDAEVIGVDRLEELASAHKQRASSYESASEKAASEAELWPDLRELPALATVPTLPADMISRPRKRWIADIAEIARTPMEMVAASASVGLGSVVGRLVGVRPWPSTITWWSRMSGDSSQRGPGG
jgi:hypothetical protein